MDIVLVPGLWLPGSSWDRVTPLLEEHGHRVRALTLPGMESKDADRSGTTLADHVAAVVAAVDEADGPVLLVAHSAGSGIAHAAVDARPDRVMRAVYVGGFPSADGGSLLTGLPEQDGEVTMPDWAAMGEEANIVDLDDAALDRLYADAIPAPAAVLTDAVRLRDERRFAVPITAVCPEYTAADLRTWVDSGDEAVSELARAKVEYVDLPGGHWPQLTQPEKLAQVILDAAGRPGRR
ncbi:alpha/beta fold hydrolase [Georgenia yuyongxinii]|uniref:Alpha/beta hydrolase n=1 Tax=Georgenia yuyongxinii TaxID=2589797 RepID=A0A552WTC9_9MICO|nr:alpha/beta hydrolase [Georgenia yuyongxinii]TRW46101.1 alpha/beta hydrolase [Georgenia yuyongxinii]